MIAAIKSLSDNSNMCITLTLGAAVFSHSGGDCPVPGMTTDFPSETVIFWVSYVRFCILCFSRSPLTYLCPVGIKVQAFSA